MVALATGCRAVIRNDSCPSSGSPDRRDGPARRHRLDGASGRKSSVDGRVTSIVTLFVLVAALAAYGVRRAFSMAGLRTLGARVVAPFGAASRPRPLS
jgi:hypothetical protein